MAELTVPELRDLIADVVEEKLAELVAVDPDEGLELRREFVEEVRCRAARIDAGEPTIPLDEITEQLGIGLSPARDPHR